MSYERAVGTVRRRWTALAVAYIAFTLGMVLPVTYAMVSRHVSPVASAGAMIGYLAALVSMAVTWQRTWRRVHGRVTADERGLLVDGKLVVAREKIRHAYVINDQGHIHVRLVRHGMVVRPIDLEVESEDEARRVLAALRQDAGSSVAEFAFTDGTPQADRRKLFGIGLTSLAMLTLSMFVFFMRVRHDNEVVVRGTGLVLYLLASGGAFFALYTRRMRVTVGADGVHLHQAITGSRFISFRDLASVSMEKHTITFRLVDLSTVCVHHLGEGRPELGYDREREGAALVARVREAHAAFHAAAPSGAHGLGRGRRSATEWIQHASALREDSVAYRAAAVPNEHLWRIVEDAAASPTERAGAALALRRDLDDAGRTRLRLAAEACAERRLRVALETATEEDEAALALALEPLEDAPARRMSQS